MKLMLLLSLFIWQISWAEMIQVPEDCIQLNLTPCLVRTSQNEKLKVPGTEATYQLAPQSILKWTQLGEKLEAELLDGTIYLNEIAKEKTFKLNGIVLSPISYFVQREERKLKILDSKKFILTEYQLGSGPDNQNVVSRIDFLVKKDLILYLAQFFPVKSELVVYLKKHQGDWLREFKAQNSSQTKVLKRSIASVEQDAKLEQLRKQQEEKDLKKVRETFFYRTFYR